MNQHKILIGTLCVFAKVRGSARLECAHYTGELAAVITQKNAVHSAD